MNLAPLIIILSVLLYGLVHSWLAALGMKARARAWLGPVADRGYRLFYNLFAILSLLPVLALPALLPDRQLYVITSSWLYLSLAGQLLAVTALGIGVWQTGALHFLGLEQLFGPSSQERRALVTGGLYRWVRHPLYTAGLVFIWLTPLMTVNLLALNLGLTIYLVAGALYEERKLVKEFGEEYLRYRARTPMLVPGLRFTSDKSPELHH
jgi:protein-S-isoprenylcysteine O-methyltransferase Ste14